jgi:Phosphoinositide phospholipase C, Ca2+-dependent
MFSLLRAPRWPVALGLLLAGCSTTSPTAGVRLNQIQVIGTHNSYHQRANDSLMKLIALSNPQAARDLDYEHRPLQEQLSQLGIRQIELDCYPDPDGGRFARPLGPKKALAAGLPPVPSNDPEGKLLKPGIKVMHIPDIDFGTSVLTLVDGLREVRAWSLKHPRHVPIFILIELKDETLGAGFTPTLPWGQAELAELEREILSVFPRQEMLTPDDVRGASRTLPEGLREHGWPMLDNVRGKVLFGMDNEGKEREQYLLGHPALEGRILFVSVPPDNAAAAWMKRNDPIKDFDQIQSLVKAGFLVRTRADEPNEQARANDTKMRDRALASGAQFISTDFPVPNLKFSPYRVQFENAQIARSNPVNGPAKLREKDLE